MRRVSFVGRASEHKMRKWTPSLVVLCTLLSGKRVGAECAVSSISIETTEEGLTISGCYRESIFSGLYETTVWTIEGRDVADTGTTAIVADLQNGSEADPVWTIGTVVPLPANSWSDGTKAGLEVVDLVCVGTSIFWETKDPTEEVLWKCDNDRDGVLTVAEAGDFDVVACGCGDDIITPSPTTLSPSPVIDRTPSSPPMVTSAPNDRENPGTAVTQAPANGESMAPAAVACNLTLSSETLADVAGCYVGQPGSNTRGYWVRSDGSSWIEWSVSNGGYWAIKADSVSGGAGETRCYSDLDVVDPVEIEGRWYCDTDGDGEFDESTADFTGLKCSAECTGTTAFDSLSDSSDNDSFSSTPIIVGSVLGGIMFAGLVIVAIVSIRRKHRMKTKGAPAPPASPTSSVPPVMAEKGTVPANPNAKTPIPMFEPWGTRPPPRCY